MRGGEDLRAQLARGEVAQGLKAGDKQPSRKSWRRKSSTGRSRFRMLQSMQLETRLRYELLPERARGTT